jgi:hypothetical protein
MMIKSIQITLIIFVISTASYSQNKNYMDDFGNLLSKEQFKEIKRKGGFEVRLKNSHAKFGIIPVEYGGTINNTLRLNIISFLEANAAFKISSDDIILIDYAIDYRCNVANNINFNKFIKAISERKNVALFLMIDNYDEVYKKQIVDKDDIIKNNFFKYINWKLRDDLKCGGALIVYPDNSFLRVYGEFNPMDILKKLE